MSPWNLCMPEINGDEKIITTSDIDVNAVKGYSSYFSEIFWQNYCYLLSNFWKVLLYCITAENFISSKFALTFSKFPMSAKKFSPNWIKNFFKWYMIEQICQLLEII